MDSLLTCAGPKEFQPAISIEIRGHISVTLHELSVKPVDNNVRGHGLFETGVMPELVALKCGSGTVGLRTRILLLAYNFGL